MSFNHTIRVNGFGKTKEVQITTLRAIRYQCIECMGFCISEIAKCTSPLCSLFPYRFGKNVSLLGKRKNNLKLAQQKAV
jgi:hypothetical protein